MSQATCMRLLLAAALPHAARANLAAIASPAVQQMRELLDRRFADPWRFADLGRVAGLSANHLAPWFAAKVGMPPHRNLLRQRIEREKELLAGSDVSIT